MNLTERQITNIRRFVELELFFRDEPDAGEDFPDAGEDFKEYELLRAKLVQGNIPVACYQVGNQVLRFVRSVGLFDRETRQIVVEELVNLTEVK